MWLLLVFYALMLICPTVFQVERGVLIILLLVGAFLKIKNFYMSRSVNRVGLIAIITSFFFIIYGVVNNAPGALKVAGVYLIWPILYFIFIGLCCNYNTIKALMKCFFCVGVLVCILNIVFVINVAILNNSIIFSVAEALEAMPNVSEGYIEFSSPSITTVLLLFYFSLMLYGIGDTSFGISKLAQIISIVLSAITILLSGRRMFWLMLIVSPLIVIIFLKVSKQSLSNIRKVVPVFLLAGIAILVGIFYIYDVETIIETFASSFDFSGNESNNIRAEQFKALMNMWAERPLLGHGLGSYAPDYVRNVESVWSYELVYIAGLMNYGIIGSALYLGTVAWIFYTSISIVRKDKCSAGVVLPFLVCLFVMLIINMSNPYLLKFDYLWTLYMPVLVINTKFKASRT